MSCFLGILLGIFPILRDGLWGFFNEKGEKVIDTQYEYISNPSKKGYYIVANNSQYGLVDSTGKQVLKPEYEEIHFLYDSLILTKASNKYFLLSADYKKMLEEPIAKIANISPDYAYYADTNEYSSPNHIYLLRSASGKLGFLARHRLLKPEYESYELMRNNYLKLSKGAKILIYDLHLRPVSNAHYDDIKDLGAYYIIKQQQRYGLVRSNFAVVLPPIYKHIYQKSFHEKMYIAYKKETKNSITIYDLETQRELLKLPFADVAELENGDLIEPYNNFPRYVQVFNEAGKTGVYDIQKKQIIVSLSHSALGYINNERFISYDNYSKFQVILNNKVISKDTIMGYVIPFDTLPVTSFYKDIIHNGKRVRFYGAFNLNGEVLVPYPVTEMQIMPSKITFSSKGGTKSVVKYDKNGKFEEYIDNYTSIIIYDTTEKARPKKFVNPCLNNKLDYSSKFQFLYTSVDQTVNNQRIPLGVKRIYSTDRKDCVFGGALLLDADLYNLEHLGIAPVITRDFQFKIANVSRNRLIETLPVEMGAKTQKRKFSFVTIFKDGLAAVDFSPPEENVLARHEKLKKYFGDFYGRRYFYSESHPPLDFQYHTGQWAFIDTSGKVVIPPRFSSTSLFHKGTSIVREGSRYLLINTKGENIAKRSFFLMSRTVIDTIFVVQEQFNGIGYMDKQLKTHLVADTRGKIDAAGNHIYPVLCKNKKWAYRHFDGTWITDSIFNAVKPFVEGYAAAQNQLWSFIDTTGKPIAPYMYAEVKIMQSGRAFVKLPDKDDFFIINEKGERIGKAQFENALPYEQNLAIVYNDGHWGVVDQTGEWVYKNEFTSITPFNLNGEAKAVKEGVTYIISSEKSIKKFDKKEMSYEKDAKRLDETEISDFNTLISSKLKGVQLYPDKKLFYKNSIKETTYLPFVQPTKYGLLGISGSLILDVEYQHISVYSGDIFKVYKQNDIGYFSLSRGWIYKPWP